MDNEEKRKLERDSLRVINFTNIDSKPFDAMWGGEVEVIEVGETKPFPKFLALHYTKHLVDKILIRDGIPWTSKQDREPLERECLGEKEAESVSKGAAPKPVQEKADEGFDEKPKEDDSEKGDDQSLKVSDEAREVAKDNKKDALLALAKENDVEIPKGSKEVVIAQLLLDAGVEITSGDDSDADSSDAVDYSKLKVKELEAEILSRNLEVPEGKQADLVAFLEAHDKENSENQGSE